MKQGKTSMARCNACAGERRHFILHAYEKKWVEKLSDDPPDFISGEDRYELLRCAGCDAVTLRHTNIHSEATDEEGNVVPSIIYYPPPTFRRPPRWIDSPMMVDGSELILVHLPDFIPRLVREIYSSLQNNCLRLSAMGVRALLESIIIDKVGDKGSFKNNLLEFQNQDFVSARQRKILEATLEIGHASIHRGYAPSSADLTYSLDVTENLIQMIYISHTQADAIQKKIPKRTTK